MKAAANPPGWDQILAQHLRQYERELGTGDPVVRAQARFGLAVQAALNAWYADEMQRPQSAGVAMAAASIAFGQVLGTMIVNGGADAATRETAAATVLHIVEQELRGRIADIMAGRCDDMKGVRP